MLGESASAEVLVAELERLGVELSSRVGTLVCNAPKGALSDGLRRRIKQLKPRVLTLLEARQAGADQPDDGGPPLSFSQARIRALAILRSASSPASNIPLGFRLTGALDPAALSRTLQALVRRHEVFRSCCDRGRGLIVHPKVSVQMPLHDLRGVSEAKRDAELRRLVDTLVALPFDLTVAPILRAGLFRLAADEWVLVLVTHVFAFDGRSIPLLLEDLGALYADVVAGRDPVASASAPRYSDFTRSQRRQLTDDMLARQRAWWTAALAGTSTLSILAEGDLPEHAQRDHSCAHIPVAFPPPLARAAKDLSRRSGATLFHVLLAAWSLLLQRYTLRESLAVGTIVSNRRGVEAERTIGSFANNILLRADFHPDATFASLLEVVRDTARSALANLDVPFESLIADLGATLRRHPPFRVMFVLHQHGAGEVARLKLPRVRVTRYPVENHLSHYLLDLGLSEVGGELSGSLAYGTERVSDATAEALIQRYLALLEHVCADPSIRIDTLPRYRVEPAEPGVDLMGEARARSSIGSPPVGPVERAIAQIWSRLLDLEFVHRDDGFFDLGGHSLLALAMLDAVELEVGALGSCGLARFSDQPTIATLGRLATLARATR